MKYKYIIALFIIGIIIHFLGALQKILHAPGANNLFYISTGIVVLALVIAVIKIIANRQKEHFLNK